MDEDNIDFEDELKCSKTGTDVCAFHHVEVEKRRQARREVDKQNNVITGQNALIKELNDTVEVQNTAINGFSYLKTVFLINDILIVIMLFMIAGAYFFTNENRKESNDKVDTLRSEFIRDDEKISDKLSTLTEQVIRLSAISERVIESNTIRANVGERVIDSNANNIQSNVNRVRSGDRVIESNTDNIESNQQRRVQ